MIELTRKLQNTVRETLARIAERLTPQSVLRREYDRVRTQTATRTPGNPAAYGYKIYSQCDEDGIIANIFSRIEDGAQTFIEIGCSDGLENNTHALLLQGWRGIWVDASSRKINYIKQRVPTGHMLNVVCALVSPENAVALIRTAMDAMTITSVDFLSLDIDSIDLYVIKELAPFLRPRVICVEYNAKFPPPWKTCVRGAAAAWRGDDYHGASLSSFVDVLAPTGYTLVACNLSGVNAFFCRKHLRAVFSVVCT